VHNTNVHQLLQFSRSSGQIIAFDKRYLSLILLLDLLRNECSHIQHIRCTNTLTSYILKTHALVFANLCEYLHKSKTGFFDYILLQAVSVYIQPL